MGLIRGITWSDLYFLKSSLTSVCRLDCRDTRSREHFRKVLQRSRREMTGVRTRVGAEKMDRISNKNYFGGRAHTELKSGLK